MLSIKFITQRNALSFETKENKIIEQNKVFISTLQLPVLFPLRNFLMMLALAKIKLKILSTERHHFIKTCYQYSTNERNRVKTCLSVKENDSLSLILRTCSRIQNFSQQILTLCKQQVSSLRLVLCLVVIIRGYSLISTMFELAPCVITRSWPVPC